MIDSLDEAKDLLAEYDLTNAIEKDDPHDIISEIADSHVDMYTSHLLEWVGVGDNYRYVEDAIDEFGFPETDGKPDFIKAIMQGQYQGNTEYLWEAWEEIKNDPEFKHSGNK